MGEVKRIFNQAKIDRDTDARMVQPGFHRDALNVSVGESEGGDVGAVENLKGNEEISGQTGIEGTTIGSVRDPNNNKVYWFTKGTTTDAIYEYNESTGEISTILKDKVGRDKIKPKCAPDLVFMTDDVADDPNHRPNPNITFTTPVGGCTIPGQFNYDANAEYNDGTCIPVINGCIDANANNYEPNANTDDGSCTYTVPGCTDVNANNYDPAANTNDGSCTYTSTIGVTISGDGSFYNSSSPVTLTTNVTNANGTVTYLWNTGETTSTITVSGSNNTTTGSVTVTDSYGSATDNYSVAFSAAPPTTTLGVSLSNPGGQTNGTNVTVTSNVTNALGSISYSWSDGATTSSNTYTGSSTTISKTLTVTDTGRTPPNHQASATRDIAFSALPTYNFNGTTVDSTGAFISAAGGQSYVNKNSATTINYTSTATLDSNYEWVTVPTPTDADLPAGVSMSSVSGSGNTTPREVTISGTWQATSSVSPTVTWSGGSAQVIPLQTYTLNASSSGSVGSNITINGEGITNQVGDENVAEGVSYTPTLSLASNYRWVSAPTISVSGLPSGVTRSAVSGVSAGGTGNASVTISGNWTPTQDETITAVWSGGQAEAIPQRRSVSISSYGGVTTSAECASRSMPITVYFSDTSSAYTGVRNGDTLYTSATGSSVYSSGSGFKTYVADGFGQALGTITISNGVVSNSNTSFC